MKTSDTYQRYFRWSQACASCVYGNCICLWQYEKQKYLNLFNIYGEFWIKFLFTVSMLYITYR